MSAPSDKYDPHEEPWPFEEVLKAGRDGARAQQKKLQDYLAENEPSLAAALAAETARFDILSRTVIEPTMRECAEDAARRGWHVSVVCDDDLDRLAVFATPGIRFYCSRRPSTSTGSHLIWPPCFVAFYGCAQTLAVRTCVQLANLVGDAVPSSEPHLAYAEVTVETVRAVLGAFLGDLERVG